MTPTEAQNLAAIASILIWCSTGPQAYYSVKSGLTRDNKFSNLTFCVAGLAVWTSYAVITAQWVFAVGDGIDTAMWSAVLIMKVRNIRKGVDTWKE